MKHKFIFDVCPQSIKNFNADSFLGLCLARVATVESDGAIKSEEDMLEAMEDKKFSKHITKLASKIDSSLQKTMKPKEGGGITAHFELNF